LLNGFFEQPALEPEIEGDEWAIILLEDRFTNAEFLEELPPENAGFPPLSKSLTGMPRMASRVLKVIGKP
jgi:hypothetical protein